jgi:hypothetical protein
MPSASMCQALATGPARSSTPFPRWFPDKPARQCHGQWVIGRRHRQGRQGLGDVPVQRHGIQSRWLPHPSVAGVEQQQQRPVGLATGNETDRFQRARLDLDAQFLR